MFCFYTRYIWVNIWAYSVRRRQAPFLWYLSRATTLIPRASVCCSRYFARAIVLFASIDHLHWDECEVLRPFLPAPTKTQSSNVILALFSSDWSDFDLRPNIRYLHSFFVPVYCCRSCSKTACDWIFVILVLRMHHRKTHTQCDFVAAILFFCPVFIYWVAFLWRYNILCYSNQNNIHKVYKKWS